MMDVDIEEFIGGILLLLAGWKLLPIDTMFGLLCMGAGCWMLYFSFVILPPSGV